MRQRLRNTIHRPRAASTCVATPSATERYRAA